MKKLFSILLSLNLILTPVALAQEGPKEGEAPQQTGTGKNGGYDFMMKQVLIMATSSLGASILTQCPGAFKLPSMIAFMSGSVANIIGEIALGKDTNKAHKRKLSEIKIAEEKLAKKGGEFQKEALIQKKKDEEEMLKSIKKRKTLAVAVNVIYLTAAALAITEEIRAFALATAAGKAACTFQCAPSTAVDGGGCLTTCIVNETFMHNLAKSRFPEVASLEKSLAGCLGAGCVANLKTYSLNAYAACLNTPNPQTALQTMAITAAWGFAASKMDGGSISQFGSMIITLLPLLSKKLSGIAVKAYNYPLPRSITFSAAALLSSTVTSGLIHRQNVAEENIKKLDKVLKNFQVVTDNQTGGVASGAGAGDGSGSGPGNYQEVIRPGEVDRLAAGGDKKECYSVSSKSVDMSPSSCSKPLQIKPPKMDLNGGLGVLNTVAQKSADLSNAMAQGDMQKADVLAEEIGSYAAKVRDIHDKLQAKYNEDEKKAGRPGNDFNKAIKAEVASMQASLNEALAQNNMAPLPDMSSSLASAPSKDNTSDSQTSRTSPVVALPDATPSLGLDSGTLEEVKEPVKEATLADSLEQFETNVEDINKAPEVSIFKQLSNRYIMNYTKIFDKKPRPEVQEDPKPVPAAP